MTVDLPTTSVVEFRRAAWPLLRRNTGGVVVMDLYLTWAALGASACILGFGLVGLTFSATSWWFVLVGLVCTVLVARRIRGRLRRARTVRDRIDALSRKVDARAAGGLIPVAPASWTEAVPPPPHERASSWM
ncbi:MAG TPA: hypothetical protein VKZ83_11285 [Phototrophicaceae bacterium]|nr:hypothetical protein [Phototrophicaceae bacterium]